MIEKIRAKMEEHINAILEKPAITNEEYMIIAGFFAKLEAEKTQKELQEELDKNKGEQDKRFRSMMECIWGGAANV